MERDGPDRRAQRGRLPEIASEEGRGWLGNWPGQCRDHRPRDAFALTSRASTRGGQVPAVILLASGVIQKEPEAKQRRLCPGLPGKAGNAQSPHSRQEAVGAGSLKLFQA